MRVAPNASCAISIHALREEGDGLALSLYELRREFLSTPSARRATKNACCCTMFRENFYPRPPRGGRLGEEAYKCLSA